MCKCEYTYLYMHVWICDDMHTTAWVAATGFALVVADFLGLPPAAVGAVLVLGSAFSGFSAFLVAVTYGWMGASVTGWGIGLGALALAICPPWTTWFHPSPRSICSAEGSARFAFGAAADLLDATILWPCSGVRVASAAFASFHLTHPR